MALMDELFCIASRFSFGQLSLALALDFYYLLFSL